MAPTPVSAGARAGAPPKPAVVKTTVTGQGATHAAARAQAVQAIGAAGSAGKAAAQKPAGQPATFNPLTSGPGQIQQFAQRIVGQQSQAQLIPLRQQAAQLQNQQMTAQNRYAGYSATDQSILGGLQADQNASALTNENAQAQAAQNTANQIDASGRAAAALNGGYTGPQAAAAQASTAQFQGGVQGAQAGYQVAQAGNNASLMSSLRQTAALQAQEGQMNIQSAYGKPIATNVAAQQAVIAKQPASVAAEANTLAQQQFTDKATLSALGIKSAAQRAAFQEAIAKVGVAKTVAGADVIKAKTGLVNAATARYRANTAQYVAQKTAQYHAGQLAIGQGGLQVKQYVAETARQNAQANSQIKKIQAQLANRKLSDAERVAADKSLQNWTKIANSTKPGGTATSTSNLKSIKNIGGEAGWYNQAIRSGLTPQKAQGAVTQNLKNDGASAQAAIELATQGYVSTATQTLLKAQGITLPATMTTPPNKLAPKLNLNSLNPIQNG